MADKDKRKTSNTGSAKPGQSKNNKSSASRPAQPKNSKSAQSRPAQPKNNKSSASRPAQPKNSKSAQSRPAQSKNAKSQQSRPAVSKNAKSAPSKKRGQKLSWTKRVEKAIGAQTAPKKKPAPSPKPSAPRPASSGGRSYKDKNRLWNTVVYLCVLMAAAVVSLVLVLTVFFKTETIEVEREGEVMYGDGEIIDACGIAEGDNLLLADVRGAESAICLSLPYIEECEVRRSPPSTVRISVTGAKVAGAITATDGRQIAVSTTGKALALINSADEAGLVPIDGVTAFYSSLGEKVECDDLTVFETAWTISDFFSGMGLRVTSITFASEGEVSFIYDGRIKVKLGKPEGLETKLALVASAFTDGSIADYESGLMDASSGDSAYFATDDIVSQYGLD